MSAYPNTKHYNYTIYDVKIGRLFMSNRFMIAEFKEGVYINYNNFNEVTSLIKLYFGNNSFGFIANRKHAYSIDLKDSKKFNNNFTNLKAYAVVAYKTITKRVFEIENQFLKFNRCSFKDLNQAIIWVEESLNSEF